MVLLAVDTLTCQILGEYGMILSLEHTLSLADRRARLPGGDISVMSQGLGPLK